MTLIQLNNLQVSEADLPPSNTMRVTDDLDTLFYICASHNDSHWNKHLEFFNKGYPETATLYTPAKEQTDQPCPHCTFRHQVDCAWEMVLQNQFYKAYDQLYKIYGSTTPKQEFVLQFVLAVIDSLCGCYENAENTLTQAPNFFKKYYDIPQALSAQIHLAHLYLRTERPEDAHPHIEQVLHWLHDMKSVESEIYWRHPEVMAHILAYAIAYSIYPHTARRIFMLQIGPKGKDVLLPYLDKGNVAVQRNVYRFYSMFNNNILELVPPSNNPKVTQTILQLLQQGFLCPEGFSYLKKILTTATLQNRPNATLIATFGLYVTRYSRTEIAKRLDMSPSSIRNYITTIYEIFNLDRQAHDGQQARFQRLLEIAKQKGIIGNSLDYAA